ncbi:hypothetical protein [Actinomadura fibrosa]|uniref:Uncharacterized protein n=1 Tax=Actinomadura fibrosa TaxID=111802 RepID=A0ABW2XYW9_9ACTN|nr:hypothetical protein [Actinomadura fibrosa]
MTQPSPDAYVPRQEPRPYDQRQYEQLVQRTGQTLVQITPPGWRRIDLKMLMLAGASDLALTVIMQDGSSPQVDAPRDLLEIAAELRSIMYRPDEGTWFGMRYMMDPPGAYWVSFNDRFDPLWDPPIPGELFAQDLTVFPRADASVPGWLREKLARPAGTPLNG